MSRETNKPAQRTITLLALRGCATSSPAALSRTLNIPRSTARYQIQKLQEAGIVIGYTPIVNPKIFGNPHLIRIRINPQQFKFKEDFDALLSEVSSFLWEGRLHAPLAVFTVEEEWRVWCVTFSQDIEAAVKLLCQQQNVAREDISIQPLEQAQGIPNYSRFSLPNPKPKRDEKEGR